MEYKSISCFIINLLQILSLLILKTLVEKIVKR